jgi:hypothetical protein
MGISRSILFSANCSSFLSVKAKFLEVGVVRRGPQVKNSRFSRINADKTIEEIEIAPHDLDKTWDDPNIQLVTVWLQNAVGTEPDAAEWLTYVTISEEAAKTDRHPMAIYTDGSMFCPDYICTDEDIVLARAG